jgi:hypothetical protein
MVSALEIPHRPAAGRSGRKSPDGIEASVTDAILRWTVLGDGSLSVDLNARQAAGPTTSVKQILGGLGLSDDEVRRARIRRERLVLRAPGTPRAARTRDSRVVS